MVGNETGEMHKLSGEFVEVNAPNWVSFTWCWYTTPDRVSLVSYRLSSTDDGRTNLILTHERFADVEARNGHAMGWAATLDSLANHLAA